MVTFSFALRKVRTDELMPKEKTIWTGARSEGKKTQKKIVRHPIDVVSGQDMIMPGVAQSNPALRIPA